MMKRPAFVYMLFAGAFAALALIGCADAPKGPAQVLLHTSAGDIRVELDDRTPQHRDNFLRLTREGFFDSLLFHRVIADFMIQGGDPDSRHAAADVRLGEGDAGYTLPAEIVYPALAHTRGALAAARTSDQVNPERRSSSSQFYIVWGSKVSDDQFKAANMRVLGASSVMIPDSLRLVYRQFGGTPHLDAQYTVFGRVVEGLEVVEAIQGVATDSFARPLDEVRILRAEVVREPNTKR